MAIAAPERHLLRVHEAAESLGIGRAKCYQLIAAGHLGPLVHIGRASRLPAKSVAEFAERLATGEVVID